MRVILKGREVIHKVWGAPSPQNSIYRLMRYHIRSKCGEGALLLNTVSGEAVLLDEKETSLLDHLPSFYTKDMNELISHHFLVPNDFNESISVNQLRKLLRKFIANHQFTSYSILPTTNCNARCFYCFESDYPRYSMTEEVAEQLAGFIISRSDKTKCVTLKWFGGEPTLGVDRIDQICSRLGNEGVHYRSLMISNGYLFSKELAQKANDLWHLEAIQITMDGTENVYNSVKAYVHSTDNPYFRVLSNIRYLLDEGIQVSLRMNLDFHNSDDLKSLIDELGSRFTGEKNFAAYVATLFEDTGYKPVSHSIQERERLIKTAIFLNNYIEEKGCKKTDAFINKTKSLSLRLTYCMADNFSAIQVNPLGQLGKCEHAIFEHLVGNLFSEYKEDCPEVNYWHDSNYTNECESCALCPICGIIKTCEAKPICLPEQISSRIKVVEEMILENYNSVSNFQDDRSGSNNEET